MRSAFRIASLALVGLALASCGKQAENAPDRAATAGPRVGQPAPEIDGEDIDGNRMKLSDFRGKVVLLDFWGFWCTYCVRWIPHEKAMVERLKGKPFVLLGVNSDRNRVETQKYCFDIALNWRSWWDGGDHGTISTAWRVDAWPTFFLIDHRGVLRHRANLLDQGTEDVLQQLVGEAEAAQAQ